MSGPEVVIAPDLEEASRQAAAAFAEIANDAIERRGACYVALSGGSTPERLYQLLAAGEYRIDWPRSYVFWSDERCVSPEHPYSNYRLAEEALLAHVPIDASHVFRLRGEADPEEAAAEYEQTIRATVPAGPDGTPRFDLLLLGVGADGHTASIFPASPLIEDDGGRLVAAVYVSELEAYRLTFAPRLLNAARNVLFLVAGEDKAEALAAVLAGDGSPAEYPARIVAPRDGRVVWFVDQAAASLLRVVTQRRAQDS